MLKHIRGMPGVPVSMRWLMGGPQPFLIAPAIVLAAYWYGGEVWLIAFAIALPIAALLGVAWSRSSFGKEPSNLSLAIGNMLAAATQTGFHTAVLLIELDSIDDLTNRYGGDALARIARELQRRLHMVLRDEDSILRLTPGRIAVVLSPARRLDLEGAIQLASRMQTSLEKPVGLNRHEIYLSCSIGFVLETQVPNPTAAKLEEAAERALTIARVNAPSAIRAYAPNLPVPHRSFARGAGEVLQAIENGQIIPWYQPQISTDTGAITGLEALARWYHPRRGLIPPGDFLPLLERECQMERLSEIILTRALGHLRNWDLHGEDVPMVSVNFASDELRNPGLIDRLQWELDRFELTPDRLGIEVLETVVANSADDIVARNINGLAELGCRIDLDDFGTGHASISSIRRFTVSRLKIDRSFVRHVDNDAEQQRMVAAILTMADRLGLDVLAEGVETSGEHAMLAQLGCAHVQGFGISRPLPPDEVATWLTRYRSKLDAPPTIGQGIRGTY